MAGESSYPAWLAVMLMPAFWQILRTVEWRTGGIWSYATFLTDNAFFDFMSCFQVAGATVETRRLTVTREVRHVWELRGDAESTELEGTISASEDLRNHSNTNDALRTALSRSEITLGDDTSGSTSEGDTRDRVDDSSLSRLA